MADATPGKKPNVILVLADNLGWGELGCYGGGALRGAPTPRIDALAAEGLRLLNFNVESDCVPTRSALMTGRHPIRTGALQSVPAGLPQGLIPWEITLAQLFKQQGYATAIHGKWHLGEDDYALPNAHGYDVMKYAFLYHLNAYTYGDPTWFTDMDPALREMALRHAAERVDAIITIPNDRIMQLIDRARLPIDRMLAFTAAHKAGRDAGALVPNIGAA